MLLLGDFLDPQLQAFLHDKNHVIEVGTTQPAKINAEKEIMNRVNVLVLHLSFIFLGLAPLAPNSARLQTPDSHLERVKNKMITAQTHLPNTLESFSASAELFMISHLNKDGS